MENTKLKNIAVVGAGAWGTALAQSMAAKGQDVTLYAREADLASVINTTRENKKYLPGITLHTGLTATHSVALIENADIVILAAPAQHLRATLKKIAPHLQKKSPLLNTAKGIEIETGLLLSEMAADIAPDHPFCVLSGPTFAHEVAKGLPAALTLATTAPLDVAKTWAEDLRSPTFRPYLSDDVAGVEMAGALKNVIAIACGIVAGKRLGENAKAAVMTRGMAEIRRLGAVKGAKAETFLGLAGIGDLTLTCSSMSSRNFSLGSALGEGQTFEAIMKTRVSVAEGVSTAKAVAAFAQKHGIDAPICRAVDDILHKGANVDDVITGLLSRHLKFESE